MQPGHVVPPARTHLFTRGRADPEGTKPSTAPELGPFVTYVLLILTAFPFYRFLIGPDAISYISVARHYAQGEWSEAINAYWSPLMSWLMAPLLFTGIPGLLAAKLVCIFSGLGVICCVQRLARVLDLHADVRSAALYVTAVMTAGFALIWITPDLPSAAIVLYYLTITFSPALIRRRRYAILCGLAGVAGFLSKAYNFYFFLAHFTLLSGFIWARARTWSERRASVRCFAAGMLTFLVGCAPWIIAVSTHVGHLTIGTAAAWNHRLVGPNSPGFPQFHGLMPPSGKHAISMWEEPSPTLLPDWGILAPPANVKHQARLIAGNIKGLSAILNHTSIFCVAAIFGYILWGLSRPFDQARQPVLVLISLALLPAGYLLVTLRDRYAWNDRYLWAALVLILLCGMICIQACRRGLTRGTFRLALVVYSVSFVVSPARDLWHARNSGRTFYLLSAALKGHIPPGSRLASCGQWNDGLAVAYYLNARYYGSASMTADEREFCTILNPGFKDEPRPTPEDIARTLRKNHIEYFLTMPGCEVRPAQDMLAQRIDIPGTPEVALFHLVDRPAQ